MSSFYLCILPPLKKQRRKNNKNPTKSPLFICKSLLIRMRQTLTEKHHSLSPVPNWLHKDWSHFLSSVGMDFHVGCAFNWRCKWEAKCLFIIQNNSSFSRSVVCVRFNRSPFSVKMITAPPCFFFFCKVNPGWQLTNDLKMATSSVL